MIVRLLRYEYLRIPWQRRNGPSTIPAPWAEAKRRNNMELLWWIALLSLYEILNVCGCMRNPYN